MTSTTSRTHRQTITDMIEAANRADLDTQAAHFHPDITYRFKAHGIDVTGRAAFRAMLGALLDRFPDRRVTVTALIVDGDRVAVQMNYTATSPGSIPGLPPAGQPFTTELCSVYTMRDGMIADGRDYLDRPLS